MLRPHPITAAAATAAAAVWQGRVETGSATRCIGAGGRLQLGVLLDVAGHCVQGAVRFTAGSDRAAWPQLQNFVEAGVTPPPPAPPLPTGGLETDH